jgi:predicted Zn-dependent protease
LFGSEKKNKIVVYATICKYRSAVFKRRANFGEILLSEMERINKLKEYLQAQPNDSFLQHALALEYIKLGDDKAAVELFDKLLAHEPGYVGSYYHLAKTHERLGNKELAVAAYEEGMKQAKQTGDRHALSELQAAWEDLTDY